MFTKYFIAFFTGLSLISFLAQGQKVVEPANRPAEWTKEYPPFRIAGNFYYVGTYDLACYLITTDQGNILINTGLASSAPVIKANIESLGFRFADTKILLITHAHYDHVGAIAEIKKMTGAALMINENDVPAMADGGRSDYALGGKESSFQPVKVDRPLHDGDTITLGNMQLILVQTAGHTKGASSFLFNVRDQDKVYKILIANMPSIVTDKSFSDLPAYPGIAKDYANTFISLKNLQFDIWVASHASQFGLHTKHKPGDTYNPEAFVDRKGYDDALSNLEKVFTEKMEQKKEKEK